MTRVHRTRAEQRADTRARLLASARRRFLRDGFHAASLDQIAEDAGFTIGAVYSRFSSKADLFLAVLDEHVEAIERRIARVGATSEPLAARAERVARLRLDLLQQEATWFPLVIEFWAHAARDPDLLRGFAARHQRLVDAYAGLIAADYARAGVPPPLPPGQLAVAVMAMGNGVALERLTNPGQVPDGLLATMALAFLRGLPPAAAVPAPAERRPP
jgi:AcrR family transcriptional regulator